jgi:hypothetical protein
VPWRPKDWPRTAAIFDGPVDHTATFLAAFRVADGVTEAVATIVNFACDATILDGRTRS